MRLIKESISFPKTIMVQKSKNNKTKVIYLYTHFKGYVHILNPSFIEVTDMTQGLQKADLQDKRDAGNNTHLAPIEGCRTSCNTKRNISFSNSCKFNYVFLFLYLEENIIFFITIPLQAADSPLLPLIY